LGERGRHGKFKDRSRGRGRGREREDEVEENITDMIDVTDQIDDI